MLVFLKHALSLQIIPLSNALQLTCLNVPFLLGSWLITTNYDIIHPTVLDIFNIITKIPWNVLRGKHQDRHDLKIPFIYYSIDLSIKGIRTNLLSSVFCYLCSLHSHLPSTLEEWVWFFFWKFFFLRLTGSSSLYDLKYLVSCPFWKSGYLLNARKSLRINMFK